MPNHPWSLNPRPSRRDSWLGRPCCLGAACRTRLRHSPTRKVDAMNTVRNIVLATAVAAIGPCPGDPKCYRVADYRKVTNRAYDHGSGKCDGPPRRVLHRQTATRWVVEYSTTHVSCTASRHHRTVAIGPDPKGSFKRFKGGACRQHADKPPANGWN
jgi:hypothetical protein